MMDWQPIETAPKTTKAILIWCPENKCTFCVSWGVYRIGEKEIGGWIIFGDGVSGYRSYLESATHWMSLPKPPE